MSDERKQEQQRKVAALMPRSPVTREQLSARIGEAQRFFAKKRREREEEEQEEIKAALCGPYGRFFNEGTD